ncbi:MAG: hypothetical protein RIQ71_24 [Verrucomicrobiota bacterium]
MTDWITEKKNNVRDRDAVFWWRLFFAVAAAGFSLLMILQPPPWKVIAEAAGQELTIAQLVYAGTWLGALGSVAIMGLLFAICPWWALAPRPQKGKWCATAAPRWFWPTVLAAVIAAGSIAAPSLDDSLWDDEHESLVWYVLGRYVRQEPDGHVKLKEHNWRRTIFGYSTPNNHIFHNILARSSNALWRAVARPKGLQFNEVALRIPAFLAGLACIAALGVLLRDFGFPAAGSIAAWFLALQPWFTEHMALARGYTITMLCTVLIFVFWRRALVSGAWLWWVLLTVSEFLLLWTYPAAVFLVAVLNVALFVLLKTGATPVAGPERTALSRWFCCTALAAAGLLPLIAPLVPQLRKYIDSLTSGLMGWPWLVNFASFVTAGAAWDNGSGSDRDYLDLQLVSHAYGHLAVHMLLAGTALLFAVGFIRFARGGKLALAATISALLGPLMHWVYAESSGVVLWEWYLIYVLPFVCMFWGVGTWTASISFVKITRARWTGVPVAVVLVCLYAIVTAPVRAWHFNHTRVPYRETAEASRACADGKDAIVFSITGAPLAYDPDLFLIEKPVDLAILMCQADAQKRRLIANMGQMQTLQLCYPGIFALVDNRSLFPHVEKFKGFFSGGDRFLCFYRPGSAALFDFAGILTPEELAYARSKADIAPEKYFSGRVKRHEAQGTGGYGPAPGVGKEPHHFRK